MKAAVLEESKVIKVKDVRKPSISPNHVLVKVKVGGICGSDLEIYKGKRSVKTPIIVGHEASGLIAEVSSDVSRVAVGDRVVIEPNISCGKCLFCRAGKSNICLHKISLGLNADGVFAEYVKVPENYVWRIPRNMSYHEAVLVEPLAVVIHAIRTANILPGDNVAVIGGGPIGALVALTLQSMRVNVALQEASFSRMKLLRQAGLKDVWGISSADIDEIVNVFFEGEKASIVIDAVGTETSLAQALKLVSPGGKIIVTGLGAAEARMDLYQVVRQEICIKGSIIYVADFPAAIKLIYRKIVPVNGVVTHKFNLIDVQKGYDVSLRQEGLKVLIEM